MHLSEWDICHRGQRKEGQERDPRHCCSKVWRLLNLVVLIADPQGDPRMYCLIWNIFNNTTVLYGMGWWGKRNKLGRSQPTHDLMIIPGLGMFRPPSHAPCCPPLCICPPSSGHWNVRSVLLGESRKPTHHWELAFCSIWFYLRDVDCPKYFQCDK